MKQSRSIVNPAVGTTTAMMMICVEWIYRPGAKSFVEVSDGKAVAEVSTGLAEGSAVAEVGLVRSPWYVGNTCDGCKVILHPS